MLKKPWELKPNFAKGLYISNPCSKGLANHNRLGQLNNESRLFFGGERQTLKRHELQQSVSDKG